VIVSCIAANPNPCAPTDPHLVLSRECRPVASSIWRSIVAARGPTVLIAAADSKQGLSEYVTKVYAGIVHNESPLSVTESSIGDTRNQEIGLIYGRDGDRLLRLDPLQRALEDRFTELNGSRDRWAASLKDVDSHLRFLHQAHRLDIDQSRVGFLKRMSSFSVSEMSTALSSLNWSRESRGAIPLAETMENLALAESESSGLDKAIAQINTCMRRKRRTAVAHRAHRHRYNSGTERSWVGIFPERIPSNTSRRTGW
jgi:hypothetical protein